MSKTQSKAEQLRAWLSKHPDATTAEVTKHFARRKIKVASSEVSGARKQLGISTGRGHSAKPSTNGHARRAKPNDRGIESPVLGLVALGELKAIVEHLGGFDNAQQALDLLKAVQLDEVTQ